MKKIIVVAAVTLISSVAFTQVQYPNFQDTLITITSGNINPGFTDSSAHQLDSNTRYRNVRDGITMQGGRAKMLRNGRLFLMESPVSLKNGAVVMTDGIIRMTNGSTPILNEGDMIDMDGNIRTLNPSFSSAF